MTTFSPKNGTEISFISPGVPSVGSSSELGPLGPVEAVSWLFTAGGWFLRSYELETIEQTQVNFFDMPVLMVKIKVMLTFMLTKPPIQFFLDTKYVR